MTTTAPLRDIAATAPALAALARLAAAHGPLLLHLSAGCCDAGTPLCMPVAELRLGARDVARGRVAGTDVVLYQMVGDGDACARPPGVLDLAAGLPVGFSLPAGEGLRFILR